MDISFPHRSGAGYPRIATTDKRFSSAELHFIADILTEVSSEPTCGGAIHTLSTLEPAT